MADNEQLTNESSQNSAVRSQHPSQELPLNRPRSTTPEEVILLRILTENASIARNSAQLNL